MKINIWIPRENIWSLNAWLKTPWEGNNDYGLITFFHDKHNKQMDLVQVSISVDEYQKIIDSNEEIQTNMADQLGWVQSTTIDPDTNAQLKMLFGD
jgi:hypothetical protein